MANFSKVDERQKLKPRRDPYWAKLSKGAYIGFRKMSAGSKGSWSARWLNEIENKQTYLALGDFSELPDNQRYDAAVKAAQAWFGHLGKGGVAQVFTLRDACEKYVQHLRDTKTEKAADDAQARFKAYVLTHPRLADCELGKLTPAHFEKWRKALKNAPVTSGPNRGGVRTDSSLNRDMTCLRAALNHALRDGLVTSDFAWKNKLLPIKGADRRRETYLDADQRRKLISLVPADLANLLRAMCLVPMRPGALAALTVSSFDKRLKTITVGRDKAGRDRKISLPDATADFFSAQCSNKLPAAPLLSRADGKAWGKDAWKGPIKTAVLEAKLPAEATCYSLRHGVITDLIHGGLDSLTVAQLSGTSIKMVEANYGHLTAEHAVEALARLTL